MTIRGGDVFINGKIAEKDVAQQRAMAINVYDTPMTDRRWHASGGSWTPGDAGVLYRRGPRNGGNNSSSGEAEAIDWLSYRHQSIDNHHDATGEVAIVDESPVDQSESRSLVPVADLLLECELQAVGDGEIYLRLGRLPTSLSPAWTLTRGTASSCTAAAAWRNFQRVPARCAPWLAAS